MYKINELCKKYGISRSTLIYYETIGLLIASERTTANYRLYSDEDINRLEHILFYRETGLSLEEIKTFLNSTKNNLSDILKKRLSSLNHEINKLKFQQQYILKILKDKDLLLEAEVNTNANFASILKSIGLKDEELDNLHKEFEMLYPDEHQTFLEFLGLSQDEIEDIREYSRNI
jgi:DNA-binding transcriptional MerR regulator